KNQPGMVVGTCNPSYSGGRGRRIWVSISDSLSEKGKNMSGRRIRTLSTHLGGRCSPC
uniref:Uncharacterized protein n=1 Tax=Piliocolobus tephrosceles TaxID=591936 RepID=A0A8C9HG76_9PRIM